MILRQRLLRRFCTGRYIPQILLNIGDIVNRQTAAVNISRYFVEVIEGTFRDGFLNRCSIVDIDNAVAVSVADDIGITGLGITLLRHAVFRKSRYQTQ